MERNSVRTMEVIVEDRTYKREVVQLGDSDQRFRLGSILTEIKTKKELEIALASTRFGANTDGISIPIQSAGDILGDRLLSMGQTNLNGERVDSTFMGLLENTLLLDANVESLGRPTETEEYTTFLKNLDPRLAFSKRILSSYDKNSDNKLEKNDDAYEIAWEQSMEDPKERIRLCEAYIFYAIRLRSHMPTVFTRTIERDMPESLAHAALLNKTSNAICKSNSLPRVLSLSIGYTALGSRSLIAELISEIVDKNSFGKSFDFIHLSLPDQAVHDNSGQRKNLIVLYNMMRQLKYEYGIRSIINNVDIAFAAAAMGMGFGHAITPLDGNVGAHFRKPSKKSTEDAKVSRYGRAPIMEELDWTPFDQFVEEYNANGYQYPFYSATAKSLNGHKDFKAEFKPETWNPIRKTIFAEVVEELNVLNATAAAKKEFVEGIRQRIDFSNKSNYNKLLMSIG